MLIGSGHFSFRSFRQKIRQGALLGLSTTESQGESTQLFRIYGFSRLAPSRAVPVPKSEGPGAPSSG
jgi:hypothetical protein